MVLDYKSKIDIDMLPVGIARFSFDGRRFTTLYANERLFNVLGASKSDYMLRPHTKYGLRIDIADDVVGRFCDEISANNTFTFICNLPITNSRTVLLEVSVNVVHRDSEECIFDACVYDTTKFNVELLKKEKEIDRLVNYDKLTGLPKRHTFEKIAKNYISNASENEMFSSVYVDVNNFKLINEKIGHKDGDNFLINMGKELSNLTKDRGCVCRAFSDKYLLFMIIPKGHDLTKEISDWVNSFTITEHDKYPDCNISMAVGICFFEGDITNFSPSVDYAAIAHKTAKLIHENNCVVFNEKMKTELDNAMEITNEAEAALKNRELIAFYQPKISLKDRKVIGAEALVRWRKKDGSIIPPGVFLPYLERSSFITKVDFYVYEEVCHLLRYYLDTGITPLPISVNFSRLHLNDKNFITKIIDMADKYEIPHKYIELELTENAFLEDEKMAITTFSVLREHGFLVSIDDFGSGYSSLNLLKTLPVDTLKMDREFFGGSNLDEGSNNAIVVSSIIDMANQMNINIICEGVETAEQIDFLNNTACSSVQGYFYAKPMPLGEFEGFRREFESRIGDDL